MRAKSTIRHGRILAVAVVIAGATSLLAASHATAHAELVSTNPAANTSLLESPPSLSMTFTEAVDPATASVQLLDDLQRPVVGLGAVVVDASGLIVTVSVPSLQPGVYTVSYRVTSAVDGHVSAGIWAFLVDPTGSQPPPAVPTQSSSPSADLLTILARWLALAASLVLLGIPVFWLVSARPALAAGGADAPQRLAAPWGAIALVGAIAFASLAAYLTLAAQPFVESGGGHPGHAAGAFPLDFAAPFGATSFATAMRVAEIGAGAAFLVATFRFFVFDESRRRGGPPTLEREVPMLLTVIGAGALSLAGNSLAGHAASRGGWPFAIVDWVHLLAVAAWVGTLPGMLLLAFRLRRHHEPGQSTLGAAFGRHSRLALAAAPVVALTGIANSPLVLGASRGLLATDYGNALLAKALLFSVAVGIGSANFFLIRSRAFRRTLPLIGLELAVAALAVLAASTLVTIQPAAGRAPVLTRTAIGTLHLYGTAGDSTLHTAVNLPTPGNQQYQVSVADAASGDFRTDVQKVILVFAAPATSGLPEQRVDLEEGDEPWLWGASGAYTPIVGDWTLEVLVRRVGLLDESVSFDLPVTEPLPPAVVPPPDTGIGVPWPLGLLWVLLPPGPAGWAVPLGLFLGVAGLAAAERQRRWTNAAANALRLVLVVAAVTTGLAVASRTAADGANAAPPSASAKENPILGSADSVARGHALYLANCAACHGLTGSGDGLTAAGMMPGPGDLRTSVPERNDGSLAYLIATGTVATRMPAFSITLSEQDRWDLVNYLRATWPGRSP